MHEIVQVTTYAIIQLAAKVFIWIGACTGCAQNAETNRRHHKQLLQNGVHVACCAGVFQAAEASFGSRSDRRQIFPFLQRLNFCNWLIDSISLGRLRQVAEN